MYIMKIKILLVSYLTAIFLNTNIAVTNNTCEFHKESHPSSHANDHTVCIAVYLKTDLKVYKYKDYPQNTL